MADARRWVVIPAAGRGERFGGSLPKQYAVVAGKTVLEHALACFNGLERLAGIVVAVAPDDDRFARLWRPAAAVHTVIGGGTRAASVAAALQWLHDGPAREDDWVLVHDAARPLLSRDDLDALVHESEQNGHGALLGVPVADTLKRADDGMVSATIARDKIWRAMTPQMFRLGALRDALERAGPEVTDEAMAMEKAGMKPTIVQGSTTNLKITTVNDLVMAEALFAMQVLRR